MQKHSRLFYNGTCRLKSSLHSLPPSISSLAPQLSLSNHSKKKSLWPLLNPSFRVCVQLNMVSLATAHSLVRAPYPPRARDNSFDLLCLPFHQSPFQCLGSKVCPQAIHILSYGFYYGPTIVIFNPGYTESRTHHRPVKINFWGLDTSSSPVHHKEMPGLSY